QVAQHVEDSLGDFPTIAHAKLGVRLQPARQHGVRWKFPLEDFAEDSADLFDADGRQHERPAARRRGNRSIRLWARRRLALTRLAATHGGVSFPAAARLLCVIHNDLLKIQRPRASARTNDWQCPGPAHAAWHPAPPVLRTASTP